MTKSSPVPGCRWAADNLLVRTRKAAKFTLPQTLLGPAVTAGIVCAVNLLSKEEFLAADSDALFGPVADVLEGRSSRLRRKQPKLFMSYVFWPDVGLLPTARQVRQALEIIEDAHRLGLRVLVNGVGHPARAAIVAGCWLAREGHDDGERRLDRLEEPRATGNPIPLDYGLSVDEQKFVSEWPTGREGQPELADLEWSDHDEVFPFAPVEHWLRVLPTVRVYPGTRSKVRSVDVPVLDGQRVSDGAEINLHVEELRQGVWIGERTLRLSTAWQVVFIGTARS